MTEAFITECAQIPVLRLPDGSIKSMGPDFKTCPDAVKQQLARAMSATVVYLKVEVHYYVLTKPLCNRLDCYAIARDEQGSCGGHQ